MATWHDLPNEIRELVLKFFCISVISEYTSLRRDSQAAGQRSAHGLKLSEIRPPIIVLSEFTWALRVCRYFHDAMTNRIKFEQQSTPTILMKHQAERFRGARVIMQGTSYNHGPFFLQDLVEVVLLIGYFWNNPLVIEELALSDLLSMVHIRSCFPILHKLLENWAQGHREPIKFSSDRLLIPLPCTTNSTNLLVLGIVIGSTSRFDKNWQVCSIETVFTTKESDSFSWIEGNLTPVSRKEDLAAFNRNITVLKDIILAPPNTWWLLVHHRVYRGRYPSYDAWYIWDSKETKRLFSAQASVPRSNPLFETPPSLVSEQIGETGNESWSPERDIMADERRTSLDAIR